MTMRSFLRSSSLLLVTAWAQPGFGAAFNFGGAYFGTFEGGRGAWALLVRSNYNLEFVGYLPERGITAVSYPYANEISAEGGFYFESLTRPTGAGVEGQIAGRQVVGHLRPSVGSEYFLGEADTGDGDFSDLGGYATLIGAGVASHHATLIVGPSGRIVVAAWATMENSQSVLWEGGASGVLDASGHVSFAAPQGLVGELSIAESGEVSATLAAIGSGGPVTLVGIMPRSRLVNLSTRGRVGPEDDALINGFIIAGSGTKRVLLRAIGPTLGDSPYRLSGVLPDPRFSLMRDGVEIAQADNWGEAGDGATLTEAMARVGAFSLPAGSSDAVLLADLPAGAYTTVVRGASGSTGLALAEVYAVDDVESRTARLVNVSARGFVGAGETVMIPGFVSQGNVARSVLVRAVGPTLGQAPHNISGVLADPILRVYRSGQEAPVGTNDDWGSSGGSVLAPFFVGVGAFPLTSSRDAALLITAMPDEAYTIVVSGKNGATGIVLAEIYEFEALP